MFLKKLHQNILLFSLLFAQGLKPADYDKKSWRQSSFFVPIVTLGSFSLGALATYFFANKSNQKKIKTLETNNSELTKKNEEQGLQITKQNSFKKENLELTNKNKEQTTEITNITEKNNELIKLNQTISEEYSILLEKKNDLEKKAKTLEQQNKELQNTVKTQKKQINDFETKFLSIKNLLFPTNNIDNYARISFPVIKNKYIQSDNKNDQTKKIAEDVLEFFEQNNNFEIFLSDERKCYMCKIKEQK